MLSCLGLKICQEQKHSLFRNTQMIVPQSNALPDIICIGLQDFAIFSPLYHMVLGVNATTTNYPFLQLLNRAQLAVSSVCGYINNLLN